MISPHRKRRGAETQHLVAAFFALHGWPHCTDAGAGRTGSDLLGVPGLAVEVKARRDLNLLAWLRQAAKQQGLAMVVHRPDGMGPASIGDWPVTFRLEDAVKLLAAAGYGDGYGEENGVGGHLVSGPPEVELHGPQAGPSDGSPAS